MLILFVTCVLRQNYVTRLGNVIYAYGLCAINLSSSSASVVHSCYCLVLIIYACDNARPKPEMLKFIVTCFLRHMYVKRAGNVIYVFGVCATTLPSSSASGVRCCYCHDLVIYACDNASAGRGSLLTLKPERLDTTGVLSSRKNMYIWVSANPFFR